MSNLKEHFKDIQLVEHKESLKVVTKQQTADEGKKHLKKYS